MGLFLLTLLVPTVTFAKFEPIPCSNLLRELERVRAHAAELEGQPEVRRLLGRVQIELEPRGFKYDDDFIMNLALAINFDPAALRLFNAYGAFVGAIFGLEPSRRISAYHESEELLNLTLKMLIDTPLKPPIRQSWRNVLLDFARVLATPDLVAKANALIHADGIAGAHHVRTIRNYVAH